MAMLNSTRTFLPYIRLANTVGLRLENGKCFLGSYHRCYCTTPNQDKANVDKSVTQTIPNQERLSRQTATQKLGSGLTHHKVDRLERYLLVWAKKYKTLNEVPNLVSQDTMERARNHARIKINLMMMGATVVGCLVMIWSGKKASREGESVVKMNEDWHRKVKEEYNKGIVK